MEQQERIVNEESPAIEKSSRTKRIYASLAVVALGVAILVAGLVGVAPTIIGAGVMLGIFGLVLLGLSFIRFPEAADTRPMSPVESLLKIFYAPVEVFRNLRHHPRWLLPLIILSLVSSLYLTAFTQRLTAKRIVDYTIGKLEQSGFQIPPEAIERSRQSSLEQLTNPVARASTNVQGFVGFFLIYCVIALIYLAVVFAMGGRINFWQSLAVVAYSAFPVQIIRYLLSAVILFVKDPTDINPITGQQNLVQDNLGVLINPADSAILYVLLSAIGVLTFYNLWLAATGLKNAGERVSAGAAWTAVLVVYVLMLSLGVLAAALFPGFIG